MHDFTQFMQIFFRALPPVWSERISQRLPRNLYIPTQQSTDLGNPFMENFPQIFQRDSEVSRLIHLRQAVIQLRYFGLDCRQLSQRTFVFAATINAYCRTILLHK